MTRPKLKIAWIEDRKKRNIACQKRMKGLMKMAEELTILSDTKACLTFFNRDDGKLVAWPSQEEAESLIDRFYALPEIQRNMYADDQESYIKTITKKIEKKLEHSQKVVEELEMDHLMFQIQNGRMLADLSQTEVEKLMSYASKKITVLTRELGAEHPYTSVDEPFLGDEIPKATDVAPEGDDEEYMKANEGESSKSGGADNA
ncbi:agamous-like MADS-box protein AGL80 [Brassica rapa]|uniref:MADS-box domain-containing protein n=2 Tax=Brassica TaxID=3705 RepID=A0A3P6D1A5_BRACM|nr:agamous-like MADS-box protein AGL80 [Brassica rapa]CAF2357948.1 unnamed protein product [Brassica napus]CAG7911848.1 unnamed protein product [Brassica rapa]VDD20730.1 unnamed protein product [Brassica rapa]